MRPLVALALQPLMLTLTSGDGCSCTSSDASIPGHTATWDLAPDTLLWELAAQSSLGPTHIEQLQLDITPSGVTASIAGGAPVAVTLDPQGHLDPVSTDVMMPVYTDLMWLAPDAGNMMVGDTVSWNRPADSEIDADTLTVQEELTVTLDTAAGGVGTWSFESRYRLADNAALADLLSDLDDGSESFVGVQAITDGARRFRLSAFGAVTFDLARGRLDYAELTGAGFPLADLSPAALAARPDAITYTLTLLP